MKGHIWIMTVCGMLLYSTAAAAGPRWQEQQMPPGWRMLMDGCQVQKEDRGYCHELDARYGVRQQRVQIPLGWKQQEDALALELGTDWYTPQTLPYVYQPVDSLGNSGRYAYFGLVAPSGMQIRLGLDSQPSGWHQQSHDALFLRVSNPW